MDPKGGVRLVKPPQKKRQIRDVRLDGTIQKLKRLTKEDYFDIIDAIHECEDEQMVPIVTCVMGSGKTTRLMVHMA